MHRERERERLEQCRIEHKGIEEYRTEQKNCTKVNRIEQNRM